MGLRGEVRRLARKAGGRDGGGCPECGATAADRAAPAESIYLRDAPPAERAAAAAVYRSLLARAADNRGLFCRRCGLPVGSLHVHGYATAAESDRLLWLLKAELARAGESHPVIDALPTPPPPPGCGPELGG